MVKYTVKELINVLKHFPFDLEIANDISFTWEYDNEALGKCPSPDTHKKEYEKYCNDSMKYATTLYLLEGDWEKETVEAFEKIWKKQDED